MMFLFLTFCAAYMIHDSAVFWSCKKQCTQPIFAQTWENVQKTPDSSARMYL